MTGYINYFVRRFPGRFNRPTLKIALMPIIVTLFTGACQTAQSRKEAAKSIISLMALDDADAPQTVLFWVRDKNSQYETYLVNGNKNQSVLLASTPSLVLTTQKDVYEVSTETHQTVLCDCQKWEGTNFEDDCPTTLETAPLQQLWLNRLTDNDDEQTDEQVSSDDNSVATEQRVRLMPFHIEPDDLRQLTSISNDCLVTGSIGPYLFIRYAFEYTVCRDEHRKQGQGYRVYNLETGAFENIPDDDEMIAIDDGERREAFESVRGTVGFGQLSTEDLALVSVDPTFIFGLGMSIEYHFEAQSDMPADENNWRDYTKEIFVQAKEIPKKLRPFVIAPSAVRNLVPVSNVQVGGWSFLTDEVNSNRAIIDKMFRVPNNKNNGNINEAPVLTTGEEEE